MGGRGCDELANLVDRQWELGTLNGWSTIRRQVRDDCVYDYDVYL